MSWGINIKSDTLPDPQECISSVCDCPGNFYTAVREMKGQQLRQMETADAINALTDLITEIDKGNSGLFSNEWCKDSDEKWSKGRETREEYAKWTAVFLNRQVPAHLPFNDYTSFCGYTVRERIREGAVRFFLYYKAGYQITYEW